jgi:hypothetical protein
LQESFISRRDEDNKSVSGGKEKPGWKSNTKIESPKSILKCILFFLSKNPLITKKSNSSRPFPERIVKPLLKQVILLPDKSLLPSKKKSQMVPKSKLTKNRFPILYNIPPQNLNP